MRLSATYFDHKTLGLLEQELVAIATLLFINAYFTVHYLCRNVVAK